VVGELHVQRNARMSLTQDDAIAVRPIGLARAMPRDLVVQDPKDLDAREARPDVSCPGAPERIEHCEPQRDRTLIEGAEAGH
jgi:hypothetical protein